MRYLNKPESEEQSTFLLVKSIEECATIGFIIGGTTGAIIGCLAGWPFMPFYPALILIGAPRMAKLALVPMIAGVAVGAAVVGIPTALCGIALSPLRHFSLSHFRSMNYEKYHAEICCDILSELIENNDLIKITEIVNIIIDRNGQPDITLGDSRRLMLQLLNNDNVAQKANAIKSYLESEDERYLVSGKYLDNSGKKLHNIIISTILKSNNNMKNGLKILSLSFKNKKTKKAIFNSDILFLISEFLGYSMLHKNLNDSLYVQAYRIFFDVRKICQLKETYKRHVSFFDTNHTKKVFIPGEPYSEALLRLGAHKEFTADLAAHKTYLSLPDEEKEIVEFGRQCASAAKKNELLYTAEDKTNNKIQELLSGFAEFSRDATGDILHFRGPA
ncbi:MAG: hypothetical protein NTZ67_07495 [Gammaproteobacteria bacterium]|nr:hypothetical protein [Gammaproteobacteria bacterium]